jgi:2-hydroxy-6-oxonona-2,4-dienedioate hydrolase
MNAGRVGVTAASEWTEIPGVRIHARRVLGAAPAGAAEVVLLHGLVVSSRYMLPLASQLADRHDVHAPDLPGFGLSPAADIPAQIEPLADVLVTWLAERGLERPHLVANSAGCQIATAADVRHPGSIKSLSLVGPTMDPSAPHAYQQFLRWLRTGRHEPWQLNRIIARDYLDAGPRRALAMAQAALADRIDRRLPEVGVPTLIVRGARDAIVTQRWAETAAAFAGGQLVVIPGAHALNFSSPIALARELERFFESSAVRGTPLH